MTSLHEYHQSSGNNRQEIKAGEVVVIHDDATRMEWKLAVVEKLIVGLDGHVRAADVRTAS